MTIVPLQRSETIPLTRELPVTTMLLSLLLRHDYWAEQRHLIAPTFFEAESAKIYSALDNAHTRFGRDLSPEDVRQLVYADNPLMTTAYRKSVADVVASMSNDLSPEVGATVLQAAYREYIGKTVANMGFQLMDGTVKDLSEISALLEKYQDGLAPDTEGDLVSMEYDDIFSDEIALPWKWNLTALDKLCPGIGPGTLTEVFAVVETGKSAFAISTGFGPGSFLDQGAKVMMICNEETAKRTNQRIVMSYSGMNLEQAYANRAYGKKIWSNVKDRAITRDVNEANSMDTVESFLRQHKPDVLIVDQLDKMTVSGEFARDDQRLSALYIRARTLAKKYDVAFIAVSQADVSAQGRAVLHFTQMNNSKIGKAAEADLIIGVGRENPEDGQDNFYRYLSVSKNKLGGKHGTCTVRIEPSMSRYVD
jgi:archaellum biogenesis ATPase FlaH|tara:strand:+ start:429 stop:1694 length:1266 start_codon:yes stop_codon:yes gene_type:complete